MFYCNGIATSSGNRGTPPVVHRVIVVEALPLEDGYT
jgi:hypothetical protein